MRPSLVSRPARTRPVALAAAPLSLPAAALVAAGATARCRVQLSPMLLIPTCALMLAACLNARSGGRRLSHQKTLRLPSSGGCSTRSGGRDHRQTCRSQCSPARVHCRITCAPRTRCSGTSIRPSAMRPPRRAQTQPMASGRLRRPQIRRCRSSSAVQCPSAGKAGRVSMDCSTTFRSLAEASMGTGARPFLCMTTIRLLAQAEAQEVAVL